jgi:hypothetical protein
VLREVGKVGKEGVVSVWKPEMVPNIPQGPGQSPTANASIMLNIHFDLTKPK